MKLNYVVLNTPSIATA